MTMREVLRKRRRLVFVDGKGVINDDRDGELNDWRELLVIRGAI